jgi:uncharacterized protein (TIGR00375 family)
MINKIESSTFIADLHIHSKYSRATARNLDIENIYRWAQRKGIGVVGTGDFTHPAWFSELNEKLEPAEPGLYRLKPELAAVCDESVPVSCRAPVRFMLSCEISNIYKKAERTRKNHNLVFFPDMEAAARFNARLDKIGNIQSDGRPILGLDARDLLEIVLDTSVYGFLIPAHIWTPWFSMLGSKSGFDSINACFEDLSRHIFAAETGLSSDPAMNWRVPDLDGITLISNSDAHSPSKLGREANIFETDMDYYAIRSAMENDDDEGFAGTFEYYPEEGKYHIDGHRKCDIHFLPEQTRAHHGRCPVCGKPLTMGVLHRVETLATRPDGHRPRKWYPFHRLIPLEDLLANILCVGAKSKKVQRAYRAVLERLGNEFSVLHFLDRQIIEKAGIPLLGEAIHRMRTNRVSFAPGYDGEFGTFSLFNEDERDRLLGQVGLFAGFQPVDPSSDTVAADSSCAAGGPYEPCRAERLDLSDRPMIQLNEQQQQAVDCIDGPLMIIAGPGTGKTRTLTHRIARLIQSDDAGNDVLAVTFTNKAAREMKERLHAMVGPSISLPFVGTFHAFGYRWLNDECGDCSLTVVDEATRSDIVRDIMELMKVSPKKDGIDNKTMMAWIASAKQKLLACTDSLDGICPPDRLAVFARCYHAYERLLESHHFVDYEDLIFKVVKQLETVDGTPPKQRFNHIFIDEFQDINAGQYRLIRLLAGDHADVCIIGDPDQSIYGFRGSESGCFNWFLRDYPQSKIIRLKKNYRSTQTILDIAGQVIRLNPDWSGRHRRQAVYSDLAGDRFIHVMESKTEKAEAVAIGQTIERMVGGTDFLSLDSGAVDGRHPVQPYSFADVGVLFRTRNQGLTLSRTLEKAGIPCQLVDRNRLLDHPGLNILIAMVKVMNDMGTFSDLESVCSRFRPVLPKGIINRLKRWAFDNDWSLTQALHQSRRLPVPHMERDQQQRLFNLLTRIASFQSGIDGMPINERLDAIADHFGLNESYADDVAFEKGFSRIRDVGNEHSMDLSGFLAELMLSGDTDIYDHRAEKVALMTMHAAKGLEFPVVFISGCEEGWIPFQSADRPADVEEERRLFYVALTRAKRHIYLCRAKTRRIHGQKQSRRQSPFVIDIENKYKQFSKSSVNRPEGNFQKQLSLFE